MSHNSPLRIRRSIGVRITATFLLIEVAGITLFGLVTCLLYRHSMRLDKIHTLEQRSDRVIALLERSQADPDELLERRFVDLTGISGESPYIQVRSLSGHLLYPSTRRAKDDLSSLPVQSQPETLHSLTVGGQEFLVVTRRIFFRGTTLEVLVGGSLAESETRVRVFAIDIMIAGVILILLTGALGIFFSRRSLSPIVELTAATGNLHAARLSERLPVPDTGDELERLARAWNDLLSRREVAVEELRQFTADTSHELRSPLALIQITAEYCLRHCAPAPEVTAALRQIVDECADATRLLTDLLALARAEHTLDSEVREQIDLCELLQDAAQRMSAYTDARQQTLTLRLPPGRVLVQHANDAQLRQVVRILLDNAIRYTQPSGSITLASWLEGDRVLVSVSDDGPGIDAEELPFIFTRFYRAAPTGGEEKPSGSGLGLAIAKRFIENHGGSVIAQSTRRHGTKITFLIPSRAERD